MRLIYLALTLVSIGTVIAPELVFSTAGMELPFSAAVTRGVAVVATLVFFALFSGPSKFGGSDAPPMPTTNVDHLLPLVPASLAEGFSSREILRQVVGLMEERRKIDAIKVVRADCGIGLKDAKELVEQIQDSIRQRRG